MIWQIYHFCINGADFKFQAFSTVLGSDLKNLLIPALRGCYNILLWCYNVVQFFDVVLLVKYLIIR